MESGRAGTEGEGVGSAGGGAKFPLEGVDVGAEGGDPVGVEGGLDVLLFQARHVGRGEVEFWAHINYQMMATS